MVGDGRVLGRVADRALAVCVGAKDVSVSRVSLEGDLGERSVCVPAVGDAIARKLLPEELLRAQLLLMVEFLDRCVPHGRVRKPLR